MNIKEAKEQIIYTVQTYLTRNRQGQYAIPLPRQRPLCLMGPPGIGKTAIVEQVAQELGIGLVAYSMTHHTRQSAIGLPVILEKSYGGKACRVSEYTMSEIIASVYDMMEEGYVSLDADMTATIEDLHTQLTDAQLQLKGEHYSRLVLQLNLPEESEETFAFLDTLHSTVARYYPEDALLVGNSTSDFDLSTSFGNDNLLISILTIVFVILVLVFTFQSAGLPVLLILVIQGSVWINFSFPYLQNEPLFFLSYLVVSSIQMGANIDYAIVIANRYVELKQTMSLKDAVIESLNEAFPTIVTSGTILASAGISIGLLSSNPAIASIGVCLGRGTLISIFLVMGILPQILMLGDIIIEKTAFTLKARLPIQSQTGNLLVNGHIRGYVSGMIDAEFSGVLHGTINAAVAAGAIQKEQSADPPLRIEDDSHREEAQNQGVRRPVPGFSCPSCDPVSLGVNGNSAKYTRPNLSCRHQN